MTTNEERNEGMAAETMALKSAPVAAEAPPTRIVLAPWGEVESVNGSFIVDDESAAEAIRAFETHGTDLPIDYEHQTLGGRFASPNGQAPAAGWIKKISAEPGVGLIAHIEWTQPAKEMLRTKQYRFLSPVAIIRKSDRKLVAIHSAALTNKPAIVGMEPIINRASPGPAFAVSDTVWHDDDLGQGDRDPLAVLTAHLDLGAEASADQVLVAASERLSFLEARLSAKRVEDRICEAVRSGRLVPAQRSWAERLVLRDESLFDEWLRTAPVVVVPGSRSIPPDTLASGVSRTRAVEARARSEYRSSPLVSALTSEEAFVADAIRQARE
ncbi:MAG: hypothetical protein IID36_01270 [Planctomycetes bacterium]|nr:hypothetical protein [Planctomycetota bacterium]